MNKVEEKFKKTLGLKDSDDVEKPTKNPHQTLTNSNLEYQLNPDTHIASPVNKVVEIAFRKGLGIDQNKKITKRNNIKAKTLRSQLLKKIGGPAYEETYAVIQEIIPSASELQVLLLINYFSGKVEKKTQTSKLEGGEALELIENAILEIELTNDLEEHIKEIQNETLAKLSIPPFEHTPKCMDAIEYYITYFSHLHSFGFVQAHLSRFLPSFYSHIRYYARKKNMDFYEICPAQENKHIPII